MYKITYYVGCNDKDTLKQELSHEDFIRVFDLCFKDYTIQECKGRYINKNGDKTFENSLIITIISDDEFDISDVVVNINCKHLKYKLNQESILVTKELIQASFM